METVVQGAFGAPTAYIQQDGRSTSSSAVTSVNRSPTFTIPTSSFPEFTWPFFPTLSITQALPYLCYVADSLTWVFLHLTPSASTHSKYPPGLSLATQDYLRNELSDHKKLCPTLFPETACFPHLQSKACIKRLS